MRPFRTLQSALAALLAACVLLLGLAAHAPALHAELCADAPAGHAHAEAAPHAHDHEHGHAHHDHADDMSDAPAGALADHVCAVTLFAAGCEAPALPVTLSEPVLNATRIAHFTEFMLARTLRGPARVCGPPTLA